MVSAPVFISLVCHCYLGPLVTLEATLLSKLVNKLMDGLSVLSKHP